MEAKTRMNNCKWRSVKIQKTGDSHRKLLQRALELKIGLIPSRPSQMDRAFGVGRFGLQMVFGREDESGQQLSFPMAFISIRQLYGAAGAKPNKPELMGQSKRSATRAIHQRGVLNVLTLYSGMLFEWRIFKFINLRRQLQIFASKQWVSQQESVFLSARLLKLSAVGDGFWEAKSVHNSFFVEPAINTLCLFGRSFAVDDRKRFNRKRSEI